MRRLYQCVSCDAQVDFTVRTPRLPGPYHKRAHSIHAGTCPSYFNCERSFTQHTMARHAKEESNSCVPLRDPRKPTATSSSSSGTETPLSSRSSSFWYNLPTYTRTSDPSHPFPGLEDVVEARLPHSTPSSSTWSISSTSPTGSLSASSSGASIMPGQFFSHFRLRFFDASAVAFGSRNATVSATRFWSAIHDRRGLVHARHVFSSSHWFRLRVVCFEGFPTDVNGACRRPRYRRLRRRIGQRAGGRTEYPSCPPRRRPPSFVSQILLFLVPFLFLSSWRTLVQMTPTTVHTTYLSKHHLWICHRTTPCCLAEQVRVLRTTL
ncbi:hypothetical protein MRX96_042210 [Rhipicephalus microplus]